MEPIQTYGQMQIRLESALEQLGSVRVSLHMAGVQDDKHINYHLKAVEKYVKSVHDAMAVFWGHTEGQLCPYKDCARDLAFPKSGWWLCPYCKRPFMATSHDGIESYHCFRPSLRHNIKPPRLEDIDWARDLGPSWASVTDDTAAE